MKDRSLRSVLAALAALSALSVPAPAGPTDSVLFDGRKDITGTLDPALDDFEKTRADLSGCTVTASASYSTFTGERLFDGDVSSSAGRWLAIPTVFGTMPDLTDGFPGTVAGSATHNTFTAAGAFDGDVTTGNGRWLASIQPGEVKAWVQWTFSDGPHAVGGYGFKNVVTGTADRAPRAWRVEGSNDGGETWTLLGEVSGQPVWALGEERLFELPGGGSFATVRFSITGDGGSDYVGLTEIQLYSQEDMAANATGIAWVQIEAPEPFAASACTIRSLPDQQAYTAKRCAASWRILASDDGVAWTTLHRVVGQPAWKPMEWRPFGFPNERAWRYWRFVLDGPGAGDGGTGGEGYVGFSELQLYDAAECRVLCLLSYDNGAGRRYVGSKAFDGDVSTLDGAWTAVPQAASPRSWIVYRFDRKARVDGYALMGLAADALRNRSPLGWRLLGSNDGGATWTEVDSDSRAAAWGAGEKTLCEVDSPGPYSWYKLDVTGLGPDAGYVGFQEIELYGLLSDPTVIVVR